MLLLLLHQSHALRGDSVSCTCMRCVQGYGPKGHVGRGTSFFSDFVAADYQEFLPPCDQRRKYYNALLKR